MNVNANSTSTRGLTELELHILATVSTGAGRMPARGINQALRNTFGRSASIGRIYVILGSLSERGLLTVRSDVVWTGERNRKQTVAALTRRGEVVLRRNGLDQSA